MGDRGHSDRGSRVYAALRHMRQMRHPTSTVSTVRNHEREVFNVVKRVWRAVHLHRLGG